MIYTIVFIVRCIIDCGNLLSLKHFALYNIMNDAEVPHKGLRGDCGRKLAGKECAINKLAGVSCIAIKAILYLSRRS